MQEFHCKFTANFSEIFVCSLLKFFENWHLSQIVLKDRRHPFEISFRFPSFLMGEKIVQIYIDHTKWNLSKNLSRLTRCFPLRTFNFQKKNISLVNAEDVTSLTTGRRGRRAGRPAPRRSRGLRPGGPLRPSPSSLPPCPVRPALGPDNHQPASLQVTDKTCSIHVKFTPQEILAISEKKIVRKKNPLGNWKLRTGTQTQLVLESCTTLHFVSKWNRHTAECT